MTYTFILYYRGGTYIEQVVASNVMEATYTWAERTANDHEIEYLDGPAFRRVFDSEIGEFPPMPINERPNVWHLFFYSGRNRMDVHIIKTSEVKESSLSQEQKESVMKTIETQSPALTDAATG